MLDSVLNKKDSIERCVQQIRHYYALPSERFFAEDFLKQDAIALNLQRACQLCIDLANLTIRRKKLGLPKESAESFLLLAEAGILDKLLAEKLKGMVGFRNILVHEYKKMDLSIMVDVIEHRLEDLVIFAQEIVELFKDSS